MLPGITFRRAEIITLEQIRMRVTEIPMPRPLNSDVVMARVEHIPRSCTSTGFLVRSPSLNCFFGFIPAPPYPFSATHARAVFTPWVTAREVTVAPEMASTVPPSFFTARVPLSPGN